MVARPCEFESHPTHRRSEEMSKDVSSLFVLSDFGVTLLFINFAT